MSWLGDPNTDTFIGSDGCEYDTDGNRLTCPGGIIPLPGSPAIDLPQRPTEITLPTGQMASQYVDAQGNIQYIMLTNQAQVFRDGSYFDQQGNFHPAPQQPKSGISQWFSSPSGISTWSNGAVVAGAAAVALGLGLLGGGRAAGRGRR